MKEERIVEAKVESSEKFTRAVDFDSKNMVCICFPGAVQDDPEFAADLAGMGAGAEEIIGAHARPPAGRVCSPMALTEVVACAKATRARSAPSLLQ
jgi:hypothetical protein